MSRLSSSPKHHLADPALATRLLGADAAVLLRGGASGPTKRGEREVDLILERGRSVLAIEVKLGQVADDHDVRHLRWLREELGDGLVDAAIVTTGQAAYRRADGIAVVPAALLGP